MDKTPTLTDQFCRQLHADLVSLPRIWTVIARLQTTGGVAAVLATPVTLTLCVRFLAYGPEEIPLYLIHAFATILGFYFLALGLSTQVDTGRTRATTTLRKRDGKRKEIV